MKRQLVRASILSIDAMRKICPQIRFVQAEPAIEVTTTSKKRHHINGAKRHRESQFHALDMLRGKRETQLGGNESYLDIIGINYYFDNQWRHPSRRKVLLKHKHHRLFNLILQEYYQRYERPILIAETGIENEARPEWFRYICEEISKSSIPVEGICLYPIVNHPGWDDNRHCHNGLWDYLNEKGEREIYAPLIEEIKRQIQPK